MAADRSVIDEIVCPGRQTVVIARGVASDIERCTDADVREDVVGVADAYAELRAAGRGRVHLVETEVPVVAALPSVRSRARIAEMIGF